LEGCWKQNNGEIRIQAYGLDNLIDDEQLFFYWTIRHGNKVWKISDERYQYHSAITFYCTQTTTYQGEVRVVDPEGNEMVATFKIHSVIDSTLDGVDDITEEMLKLSDGQSDTDGDGLTDTYEMAVSNTSYLDPDTDGDLLWDGQSVNGTIGELAVSTDPLDWDSDDDFLSDGSEYFGWNITVVYFENSSTFQVTSDSLDNDTDNDGLSDYDEYYAGSHPRQADTDNDDLTDDVDPFPTKWDGDEDLLSDYEEILRGTDYNNTDSDQDGLKDGEEVYGWGIGFFTNPLDADSDHDHVSDSAEIKNYLVKLQDEGFDDLDKKVNLSQPVSLHFPHHFEQASAAQISFGISFGEFGENATDSYGVEDGEVPDMYVIITKKDDGTLLANFSTNGTRYFSQVIDITPIMNNISLGYDYFGDYEIGLGIKGGSGRDGVFPATYSFENDEDESTPNGWTITPDSGMYGKIISEKIGHHKVLEMYDSGSSGDVNYEQMWSYNFRGTIESWWYTSDATGGFSMQVMSGGATYCIRLYLYEDYFKLYTPSGWVYIRTATDNTWYHVRIDYETGTGGYQGLSADTFYVYINDTRYGPYSFYTAVWSIDHIQGWTAGSLSIAYYSYLDAVGYSWDNGYDIGDNIQDTLVNYRFLESGNYFATYSFENEEDNTVGTDIDFIDEYYPCYNSYAKIVSEFSGHAKVVDLYDAYSSNYPIFYHYFDNSQTSGTMEFWWRTNNAFKQSTVALYSGGSIGQRLMIDYFKLKYYDGSWHDICDIFSDAWYHIRVDFECGAGQYEGLSADTFYVYVNGVKYGPYSFQADMTSFDRVRFWTSSSQYFYHAYFDAFGFTWDPNYYIGKNRVDQLKAGCYLDYFELEFCRYLDPLDSDTDDDGILDGVEMGILVEGTDLIDFNEIYVANEINKTPVSHWILEEGTGTIVEDYIGSKDGTIYGATWDTGIQSDYCLRFDGTNDYVELPSVNPTDQITVSAWVKSDSSSHYGNSVWQFVSKYSAYILGTTGSNSKEVSFLIYGNGVGWDYGCTYTVPDPQNWHLFAGTYNSTSGETKLYVDGELKDTESGLSPSTLINSDSGPLNLGRREAHADPQWFDGCIDDVQIYDMCLNANEIKQLFKSGHNVELVAIGNYSATYSFEDEADGTSGTNIDFVDYDGTQTGGTVSIVGEYKYHNKVLRIEDNHDGSDSYIKNYFDYGRNNGTIEGWFASDDTDKYTIIYLFNEIGQLCTSFHIYGGNFRYWDAQWGTHVIRTGAEDNVWYHWKIVFNCSTDTYDLYIDGQLEASSIAFMNSATTLNSMNFNSGGSHTGYNLYFDAIGYCWYTENHSYYWEGMNYEEQLPNISDIGHYPATYSFEEDTVGGHPVGWIISEGSYTDIQVEEEVGGHKNVISVRDWGTSSCYAEQTFSSGQSHGTIEWWFRSAGTSGYRVQDVRFGWSSLTDSYTTFRIVFYTNYMYVQHGGGTTVVFYFSPNTWYHLKFTWDSTSGGYDGNGENQCTFYVDGEDKGTFNFWNHHDTIDKLHVQTWGGSCTTDEKIYHDAFGHSWDPNYEIGDNLNSDFPELTDMNEYYLEIPQIGEVSDAELDIKIESLCIPEGSGQLFAQLIKEEINLTKSDIILLQDYISFDSSQIFVYSKLIDLSAYCTSGEVYSTYKLQLQLFSTAASDIFNLLKFEIETDTFVVAEFGDTEAWVTNPAANDTDGDTISDYDEIFGWTYDSQTFYTNPLSVDTDADDCWDNVDREPLKDLMLEIKPDYGEVDIYESLSRTPLLQIVINMSFVIPDYSIITPCILATQQDGYYDNFYHRADFTELTYYVNLDDNIDAYEEGEVMIPLRLYLVKRHLGENDEVLADSYVGGIWYDTTSSSPQNLWTVFQNNWVYVDFTLVAIERANVFAVYNINSTFTGRYHDRAQRYTIIQMQIPDDDHYLGSESFLEEEIGANSTTIDFIDMDNSAEESCAMIVEDFESHTNVLRVEEGDQDHTDITHNFGTNRADGTIEWWWCSSDVSNGELHFILKDQTYDAIWVSIRNGYIQYRDSSGYHNVFGVSNNQWYRMKIVFYCKVGQYGIYLYDIYVDGTLRKEDSAFYTNRDDVDKLQIKTGGGTLFGYFDAFGYSWDNGYSVGDNANTYSVSGTPFEHGMNVIVIPTESFTHTLLNGYLENDELDQTPLYHPDPHIFEFVAIGRNGQSGDANSDVDFHFYRRNISPSDAMEVLELLLYGLLNETHNEENAVKLHDYACTKINGTKATDLNLPFSVLGFVTWFNPYSNSQMGGEPVVSGGFDLWLWLLCLFVPYAAQMLHSQMAMTGGQFYKYLAGFATDIIMKILSPLGDLLWLIARAALLVFVYICLAFEFFFISLEILTLGIPLLIMSQFSDFGVNLGLKFSFEYGLDILAGYLLLENSNNDISIQKFIVWNYWDYFDLYIPWIVSKTLLGDAIISEEREDIFGNTETVEGDPYDNPISEIQAQPILFNNTYVQLSTNEYAFRVTYKDVNFNSPDQNYGVRLHLIAPNGTAFEYIGMNCEESSPDYTSALGVNFSVTVDMSIHNTGLWHYYFSTKDGNDGNMTVFPNNGYFIGPTTVNTTYFLFQERVTTSSFYFETEGWANEDFNFYVSWWDMVEYTAPENVYLCLVPANNTLDTGVSKTSGIQRFLMQPVSGNPNYSNPVEYKKVLNFDALGYERAQLGYFSYYFEAKVINGNFTYGFDYNEEGIIHFNILVKTINSPSLKVDFKKIGVSSNLPDVITDNSFLEFKATYIDSSCTEPENISISFTNLYTHEVVKYNMTKYYSSLEGDEHRYYMYVKGSSLECGSWDVDLEIIGIQSDVETYSQSFALGQTVVTVLGDVLAGMNIFSTTINFLGFLPMMGHIASLLMVIAGNSPASGIHGKTLILAGNVLAITTTIVALTFAITQFILMVQNIEEDLPRLIGFAIGCMFIFVFYGLAATAFKKDKPCEWISPQVTIEKLLNMRFIFTKGLSSILLLVSIASILLGLFFPNVAWGLISGFASAGFSIVRNSLGLLAMSLMLGIILGFLSWFNTGKKGTPGAAMGLLNPVNVKTIKWSMIIYSSALFVLAIAAFTAIGFYVVNNI